MPGISDLNFNFTLKLARSASRGAAASLHIILHIGATARLDAYEP